MFQRFAEWSGKNHKSNDDCTTCHHGSAGDQQYHDGRSGRRSEVLDAVELIMQIEEEFEVEIPDEVASNMKTVKDIVDYIEANK